MATTSPDNIYSADSEAPYNISLATAAMADSVQSALSLKANYGLGTTSQMNSALNRFSDGAMWFNTTDNTEYRRVAGAWVAWVAQEVDTGWVPINFTHSRLQSALGYVRRCGSTVWMAGISIQRGTAPNNATIGTIPPEFTQGFGDSETPNYITIPLAANSNDAHGLLFVYPTGEINLLHYNSSGATFLRGSGSWPAW